MRNKKILSLFMFMLGVFLVFSSNVLAYEVGVDYGSGPGSGNINYHVVSKNIGTARSEVHSYIKISTTNKLLYCLDEQKGNPSPSDGGTVYWNCESELTANRDQIFYLISNGYKYTGNGTWNSNDDDDFFVTQLAIWHFARHGDEVFKNFDPNRDSINRKIQALIDAADAYAKVGEGNIKLSIEGSDKMNVTSDGKYFISNKITLSGSDNITDKKATITVSGVNGAFVTKDANATSGTNTFIFGDKIYIKVPVKNVNQSSEIKITAQGSYIRYSGKLYDCTHVGNSIENQNVVDYDIIENKKNASASLTTKITLNKVVISKTDITGSKEIAGAKLSVKQGNTEVTSWTSTTTPKKLSLAPGTYTLEETIAPKGYIKSTSKITFVVKSDGTITVDDKKVTSVVMKNEPITIYISKKSINGKTELPGAKLKVTDKDGKVVTDLDGKELEWISSTKEVSFHLAAGTYYLTETIAPEGYELSDTTIEFTVTEDGKVKMDKKDVDNNLIVFTNTPEPTPVKTGSFMIYIVVIGILSVGLVTYYVIKKQIV